MSTKRVLILALAPFEDATYLVEPLAARRATFAGERITVAAPPATCDVVRSLGLAEASWDFATRGGVYPTGLLLARAARGRFDAVVDLFPHLRSLVASRLAAPGRRASRGDAAFVGTLFRVRAKLGVAVDPVERIASLLGVAHDAARRHEVPVDPTADAWIERALGATGYRGGEPVVVVHSTGKWEQARLVHVAERLRADFESRLVVIDTPREGRRARTVAGALGGTVLGVGTPPAARFLAALARASLVLTDDAGVAHLAGLMHAPSVLVTAAGKTLPPSRVRREHVTAPSLDAVSADAVYDAAVALMRKERTGPLFAK